MANFVLKKKSTFTFALEAEPEKVYTIPSYSDIGIDDFTKYFGNVNLDTSERLKICKEFISTYAPEVAEKVSDVECVMIMGAYVNQQGLGEK